MFSGKRFALIAGLALSLIVPMQSPAVADYTSDENAVQNTLLPEQEMFWLTEPIKNSELANLPGGSYIPGQKPRSYSFAGAGSNLDIPVSHVRYAKQSGETRTSEHCEGWNDSICRQSGNTLWAKLFIPPCSEDGSSSCIESLNVSVNGTSHIGAPIRSIDTRPVCRPTSSCKPTIQTTKFASVPSLNIPAGSSPSIWATGGVTNASGTDAFLVSAMISLEVRLDKSGNFSSVSFTDFVTSVIPFKEVSGEFTPAEHLVNDGGKSTWGSHALTNFLRASETDKSGCVWKEDLKCGIGAAFLQNTRVELGLRVPVEIDGWLQGRMANANVEIVPIDKKLNKITIAGDAIELPVTGTYFTPTDTLEWSSRESEEATSTLIHEWAPQGANSGVRMLTMFQKELGDRAIGRVSLWTISLIQSAYTCENKKTPRLEGLLTTNAMVYNGGLPTYKKGALSYQVGGLHYNHDGTVFKGSYDFIMRSDTARCIYGFTKAPVQVAVTVTDVNGVQSASTSSVSESGGWLRIRARDFTFSTPTITAKITQKLSTSVKNDKISQKSLAKIAKVSIGKKDKVTISVSGSNKKFAKVKSGNVSFKKNGTYQVKIKVNHYKGTTETATISVKVQ